MSAYAIEHFGIGAGDPEAIASWYTTVLGFSEFYRSAAVPPAIFLKDAAGMIIEIFPRKLPVAPFTTTSDVEHAGTTRSDVHIAIAVDDFDCAVSDLESRGAVFTDETKDIFAGGKARFFEDPEGNRLHIVFRPTVPWSA